MTKFKQLDRGYQDGVTDLLRLNSLPFEDLDLEAHHVIGAFTGDKLEGIAALEVYDTFALLRSVSIFPDHQGKGLGSSIVKEIISQGQRLELNRLYLLTGTAEAFFTKHGFKVTDRSTVPESILETKEFQHLCPASTVCMSYQL